MTNKLKTKLDEFKNLNIDSPERVRIKKMYESIVKQTKEYINKAGFKKALIGLSGGIDSSLVAKILVDALGSENILGVLMPGPFSSESSVNDSISLSQNLNIKTHTFSIDGVCSEFNQVLNLDTSSIAYQNIQSRCRMIYLMALSNNRDYFLVNTGNKSECWCGYSTIYGDMAGMYAPIGDVYKTDVFKLCVYLNKQAEQNSQLLPIPENVINKKPSAELGENQTDESSLGIDYASLDEILSLYIDKNNTKQDIEKLGYKSQDLDNVFRLVKKSEFKRRYEPPCAKLSNL